MKSDFKQDKIIGSNLFFGTFSGTGGDVWKGSWVKDYFIINNPE